LRLEAEERKRKGEAGRPKTSGETPGGEKLINKEEGKEGQFFRSEGESSILWIGSARPIFNGGGKRMTCETGNLIYWKV